MKTELSLTTGARWWNVLSLCGEAHQSPAADDEHDSSRTPSMADASHSSLTHAGFQPTHWSVVLAARQEASPRAADALAQLCRAYWYPLYAHARRRGHAHHAAEDLTQEFFARLLAKQWLKQVAPEKGRFRTFLLVALDNFLANDW